jgi:hypothetical protein
MTPAAIIREAAAAGVSLALSPAGTIKATGDQVAVNRWLPLLREHKAEIVALLARDGAPPDLTGISPEFAARLSPEDLKDLTAGDIPLAVQAFEQAAIAREAEDLREAFEEHAGILEFDAGMPRPEAELEAARITATYARNRAYLWASLRWALSGYPDLASQVPATPGTVDSLPLGTARVHVREAAKPGPLSGSVVITDAELDAARGGRTVVRQGTFTGAHEVAEARGSDA